MADAGRISFLQPHAAWLLLLAVPAAAVRSQTPRMRGVIDATVVDSALSPIAGATGRIVGTSLHVVAGDNGRFRVAALPPGAYVMVVRRIGYEPLWTTIVVQTADTLRPVFVLRPTATTLDKVVVRGESVAPGLNEFEARRARGVGQFMSADQITRLAAASTSDVLRTFQSVAVTRSGVLNTRGFATRQCPYRIFIDGIAVSPLNLDADVPPPPDLAGIEIYDNSTTVPIQYATFGGAAGTPSPGGAVCGVILLWTKR